VSFDIYLATDGYWWWRLYDVSGRVICHATQGHASPNLCRCEVDVVKTCSGATVLVDAVAGYGAGSEAL
jgi:uncharacterized protein YegP (UPF0339 family)